VEVVLVEQMVVLVEVVMEHLVDQVQEVQEQQILVAEAEVVANQVLVEVVLAVQV
jgi:hypothetical protein